MADKARDAFRTISEVANWLDIPAHVLRFWESKFLQIKPVKRAGGRRYYRPSDMRLIGGIKKLLHDDGLTIRGVQKMLKEDGIKAISELSPALDMPSEEEGAARRQARRARRQARQTAKKGATSQPVPEQTQDDVIDEAPFTHVDDDANDKGGDNVVSITGSAPEEAEAADDQTQQSDAEDAELADSPDARNVTKDTTSVPVDMSVEHVPDQPQSQVPADPDISGIAPSDEQKAAAAHRKFIHQVDMSKSLSDGQADAISRAQKRLQALRDRMTADLSR